MTTTNDPIEPQRLLRSLLRRGVLNTFEAFRIYRDYLRYQLHAGQLYLRIDQTIQTLTLSDQQGREQARMALPDLSGSSQRLIPYSPEMLAYIGPDGENIEVADRSRHVRFRLSPQGGLAEIQNRQTALSAWLDNRIMPEGANHLPLDLYLPHPDLLVVSDRGGGHLICLDSTLTEIIVDLPVRSPGGSAAINVVAQSADRLLVTDGTSNDLIIVSLKEKAVQRRSLNHGQLGNLCLAAGQLYIMQTSPNLSPSLLVLNPDTGALLAQIQLPGKRFSDLDDPCDLIAVDPTGRSLYVMTYVDDPSILTPVLTEIDLASRAIKRSLPLRKEEKPVGLGFSIPSISWKQAITFERYLIDQGVVTADQLAAIVKSLQQVAAAEVNKPDLDPTLVPPPLPEKASKELQELIGVGQADQLLTSTLDWNSRPGATEAEKASFIQRVDHLQASTEVSRANGTFVLQWLDDLLA